MRSHPEAVRNRLELLGFLVNASAFPPEPRLMHEWPMRRVHQSDNPVVNVRRQFAGDMRDFVISAEHGKPLRRRNRLRQFRPRGIVGRYATARAHIDPDVAVALFAGIMPRKNTLHFQLVLAGKRRNFDALPAASIESPAVITAFHHFSIEPPVRKRNPAVRTGIPYRKHFSL